MTKFGRAIVSLPPRSSEQYDVRHIDDYRKSVEIFTMSLPKLTGNLIRAGRALAGLTRDDLAERAGLSRDVLRSWEVSSDALVPAQYQMLCRPIEALEAEGIRSTVDGVRLQRAAPVTSPAKQGSRSMSAALLEKAARCRCWPRVSRPVTWASLFC
jgi:transcriptional regulator with XRE-family HTH domain